MTKEYMERRVMGLAPEGLKLVCLKNWCLKNFKSKLNQLLLLLQRLNKILSKWANKKLKLSCVQTLNGR